ncbi:hypothetical protein EYR40_009890 [Pleurotus pulmonarius]|nr:hypothetical protein EYR40_009890 [Pleurotus pulmonarius]
MSPLPSFTAADAVQSTAESANDRSTVDITWSCLAVIFSCTWVAIHPNIPPRHIRSSRWKMLRRRIILMLWTILVPELMVLWAAGQWFDAAQVVRDRAASLNAGAEEERNDEVRDGSKALEWTRMHGFFMVMGGALVPVDGKPTRFSPTWDPISMALHQSTTTFDTASINSNHISMHSSLPPTNDTPLTATWPDLITEDIEDKSKGDALAKLLALGQVAWFILQFIARSASHLTFTELEVATLSYASVSGLLYFFWWDKPLDIHQPISEESHDPLTSLTPGWLSFFSGWNLFHIHGLVTEEPVAPGQLNLLGSVLVMARRRDKHSFALCGISSSLFGAIHCLAWHSAFPSAAESLLWRASSISVTVIPIFWFSLSVVFLYLPFKRYGLGDWSPYGLRILTAMALCMYFLARLLLIVEAFVLLRDLPPSAYQVVNWTTFIPHI